MFSSPYTIFYIFVAVTGPFLFSLKATVLAFVITGALVGFSEILERKFGEKAMPRATVTRHTERFELKTCPEGFVVIRRMTYGEKLSRQDEMMDMRANTEDQTMQMQIQMLTKKIALQDFANLVVEHNLTDENDQPLNFRNPEHVLSLEAKIGDEIGQYIDQMNSFEEKSEVKN